MGRRSRRVRQDEGGGAGEPPFVRARVESVPGPRWTLSSRVADVLLDGAPQPNNKMLSRFIAYLRIANVELSGDVQMSVFVNEPELYIPDEHARRRVLNLYDCQTYALVHKVVPLLRRKGITDLKQWGGADENTDAKRAVRDALADDGLWNTTRGLLDSAFNVAKDAEEREKERIEKERTEREMERERERVQNTGNVAGKVILGAFESVVNARWSRVLSGEAGVPLGMRVVDGRPRSMWSYAEVNYNPSPRDVDKQAPRNGKLEIMVLSSEDGWPYTQFKNETANVDNNAGVGRGGVFNTQRSKDVYIRREVVRVWYIVEEQMRAWYIKRKLVKPRTCVVVGTPGIGKSFACGSFLLYQLLHYKNKLLDVVAYFIRDSAYVIHNARPGVPGSVVLYSDQRAAVLKIKEMASCKRGFVIVDISEKGEVPSKELPTDFWPTVVLTSPDVNHYNSWEKDRNGKLIYVNCDDERDLKAFVAWKVLRGLPEGFERNARLLLNAGKKLKEQLKVLDERIETVGPLARFMFCDDIQFKQRETQVTTMLNGINENNKANYKDILCQQIDWQNNDVTHKLVKIVRVCDKPKGADTFRCRALSFPIFSRIHHLMLMYFREDAVAKGFFMSRETAVAFSFEDYSLHALLFKEVLYPVSYMMKYLRREGEVRDVVSVLEGLHLNQLGLRGVVILPTARQRPIAKCKYMVMYKPCIPNYPVVDAFFFVEGHPHKQRNGEKDADGRVKGEVWRGFNTVGEDARRPKKTIVMVQVTTSDKHPTSTTALVSFQRTIARNFAEWNTFSENLRWEMIYVNCPGKGTINERQVCEDADEVNRSTDGAMAERKNAAKLWEEIHQWQVTISDPMSATLALAEKANKGKYHKLFADKSESAERKKTKK